MHGFCVTQFIPRIASFWVVLISIEDRQILRGKPHFTFFVALDATMVKLSFTNELHSNATIRWLLAHFQKSVLGVSNPYTNFLLHVGFECC